MRVIKKINNNVAVCVDSNNLELIAYGKGIGFPKMPYELDDLGLIDRTFYHVDAHTLQLFKEIPEDVMNVALLTADKAKTYLATNLSDSFVFTLADHLMFAIQRTTTNQIIQNPLFYDIKHLYRKELELAKWTRRLVYQRLGINLPVEEETNLSMHFINAQLLINKNDSQADAMRVVDEVTFIIEQQLSILIDRDAFNFARFTSHLQYLLKRKDQQAIVNPNNKNVFNQMNLDYPDVRLCALEITHYFKEKMNWELNDDEVMYLMMHINRLYSQTRL